MVTDFFINVINEFINSLASIGQFALDSLPTSPIQSMQFGLDSNLLKWFNWVFPTSQVLSVLSAYLIAIGLYYLVSIILRWVKAIE